MSLPPPSETRRGATSTPHPPPSPPLPPPPSSTHTHTSATSDGDLPHPHPHLTHPSSPITTSAPSPAHDPFLVRKRIAILGAHAVGKSALTIRCAQGRFEPDYILTFEDMYQWKPVVDGIAYDVTIVDTEGQDLASCFGLQYTIGVDGYILVFSVRDRSTFDVVKALNRKLLTTLNVLDAVGTSDVPRVLVGNQVDIAHEREVDNEDAKAFAAAIGVPYVETSAATTFNVNEVFETLLRLIDHNVRLAHSTPQPPAEHSPPRQSPSSPDPKPPSRKPCFVQ